MKNKNELNSGFTLVETLVAVSIFTVSLIGIMSVLASGIANTNYAKRKVIASYLAQEGIEYIRNMRDTYVLYGVSNWGEFRTKLITKCQANGCYFDDQTLDYNSHSQQMVSLPEKIISCPGGPSGCPPLLYSASGKYGYVAGGTNSGYVRKINIDLVGGGVNEIKITSKVEWKQGSGTYNITFSENLFNWVE